MKSRVVSRYLIGIGVYTVIFMIAFLLLDLLTAGDFSYLWLQGVFRDKLRGLLVYYIIGCAAVTIVYLFRLARILKIAGQALRNEQVLFSHRKIPAELQEFALELQGFKRMIQVNEEARRIAEQQKNDLIVYLAHDLKTPLTSVIGYLSLLDEAPDIPVEQRAKYTGIALDKAYRLENLINEFFEITRLNLQPSSLPKVPFDLSVLLFQVINEFYPMLEEKGMTAKTDITPALLCTGDADKLARVFENLLRNAVNYGWNDSQIECNAYRDGQSAVIRIRNAGNTIPADKLMRLFDQFYRLDDARQSSTGGTGLGLAIAKQIVEMHSGQIGVTSVNNATEFTVILPLQNKS